jgi:hypothetical protein
MPAPITPDEVIDLKQGQIPDSVFEVFNRLIAENFSGKSAVVKQGDVLHILVDEFHMDRQEVFDRHWLDVEPTYEAAGWKVVYDKPGYNENYPATFEFSRR